LSYSPSILADFVYADLFYAERIADDAGDRSLGDDHDFKAHRCGG
jgi:hypothetical protein